MKNEESLTIMLFSCFLLLSSCFYLLASNFLLTYLLTKRLISHLSLLLTKKSERLLELLNECVGLLLS